MTRTARNWVIGIGVAVLGLWLVKYVSEIEMRRLDREVDRLCAIDGRSVIYETVRLPISRFNEYGQPMVPQGGKDDTGFGYFIQLETHVLFSAGPEPAARLTQDVFQIIRTADRRVLAEHINYNRSGGQWLAGMPGIGSGRNCPQPAPADLRQRVFLKE